MLKRIACFILVTAAACAGQQDGESCPTSVAAYCGSAGCPMTLTAAQDAAAWPCNAGRDAYVAVSTCGDVHVASIAFIDAGKDYYYDANGQLYRVEEFVNTTHRCLAGSGERLDCYDPNAVTVCMPPN